MRMRPATIAPLVAGILVCVASSAHAYVVAGWDFSQYLGDGILSVDGQGYVTTLPANYSNLDPTFNAGAESAAFGTMYMDGEFGSTSVDPADPVLPIVAPTAGSLASNLYAPAQEFGSNPFDSQSILVDEGQMFFNLQSLTASQAASIVFKADLGSVSQTASNWRVTFGGKMSSGTSMVGVDASFDGSGFGIAGSVTLTDADTQYVVDLGPTEAQTVYVRLNLHPADSDWPIIDNVAVEVPEPGATAQVAAALLGLFFVRRRVR